MGTFRSLRRKLNAEKVWVAQKVTEKRNEIVKSFVEERIKTDVEFAKDVLKAVGEDLPEHLKKAAEETIKNSSQINVENVLMINNNLLPNTTTISPMLIEKEILNDGTLAKLVNDAIKGKLQVNPIVKKWEKTGIFDRKETDHSLMKPIIESQAKKLLNDDDGTLAKFGND